MRPRAHAKVYRSPVLRLGWHCTACRASGNPPGWYDGPAPWCCNSPIARNFVVPKDARIEVCVTAKPTRGAVKSDWCRAYIAESLGLNIGPVWWWVEIVEDAA